MGRLYQRLREAVTTRAVRGAVDGLVSVMLAAYLAAYLAEADAGVVPLGLYPGLRVDAQRRARLPDSATQLPSPTLC